MYNWVVVLPMETPIPSCFRYYIVGNEIMIPVTFESAARRLIETEFSEIKGVFAEPKPFGFFADKEFHHE
jgi:hypothetical protein